MSEIVPAASLAKALHAFRASLGNEWVFAGEEQRLDAYKDAYPVRDPGHFRPASAIAPNSVEQVRAVLKIANQHKIPLWVVSTGRNLAYGSAAPRLSGSVVVDLSRMNRIIEVNVDSAYCVVEPGVTYFQLYQHLKEANIPLWLSPPEPGWASVMGNALDHGVGYTPMGDNFGFSCGMEVVLPDGELLRTGMGAMAKSNSWQLFKYGFGPVVDGLFTQSNFGVVTKLGMWLMPKPPAYRSYMVSFPRESDLAAAIEIMRPLKISNIIQNCAMLTPWTYEATLRDTRSAFWDGEGPIPADRKQGIIDKLNVGFWNLYGAQYGTPAMMDEYWGILKGAFSQIAGAKFYFAEERPDLLGVKLRNLLGQGVPNMATFNVLNWVPGGAHVDFSPVSPSTGADATKIYGIIKEEVATAGLDYIGAFIIGWREMHNVVLMIYNAQIAAERDNVHAAFKRLVKRAAAEGYGEYRTHIAFMDDVAATYDFNDGAMLRFSERLKDALDPNGILAPGKSGIWPKHLRGKNL